MKMKINLLALILTMVVIAALLAGGYFLHEHQMRRYASVLLERASQAEAEGKLSDAIDATRLYLNYHREDTPGWKRYADLMAQTKPQGPARERVYLIQERALQFNPEDETLRRRSAELAMALGQFNDARRNLLKLYEKVSQSPDQSQAMAQLEDLLAQCDQGVSKYPDAETLYRKAIEHDPGLVETYDRLARMLRDALNKPEEADQLIARMIEANPRSPRAYLLRWRYFQATGRKGDPADIDQALKLAPEDPEILLAAAVVAEARGDSPAALAILEKGQKAAPENPAFPLGLARLALRDDRPEDAERILRQAVAAIPSSVELSFFLADALINLGRIEGKDNAADLLARLRTQNLAEGFVRFLEARILMAQQDWPAAIKKIDTARSLLTTDPDMTARLNTLQAECYGRLGARDEQLAAQQRAASVAGTSADLRAQLADNLAATGRFDEALKIHLALVESRPQSLVAIARLMLQQNLLLPPEKRRWEALENQLAQAAQQVPDAREEIDLLRAQMLFTRNNADEARKQLDAAIERTPKSVPARLARASLARAQEKREEALQILDQASREIGPNLDLELTRLNLLVDQGGDRAKAQIATLASQQAQYSRADQARLLDALGLAAYRLGDRAGASAFWSEFARLEPDNLRVLQLLVDVALEAGKPEAVPPRLERMKQIDGANGTLWRFAEASYRLDLVRRGARREAEAVKTLAADIERLQPESWGPQVLRGQLAAVEGQGDEAVSFFTEAVDQGCNNPAVTRALASLLYQRQRFDEIEQLERTLSSRGVDANELKIVNALNALRKGDFDRGLAQVKTVIPANSNNAYEQLFLGRMLLAAGRLAEAETHLKKALELAPAAPDAYISYTQFLVQANRAADIPALLQRLQQSLPADQAQRTLAVCQSIAGLDDQSASAFEAALKTNPDDLRTVRLAAEFYVKTLQFDKLEPLITRLLDPASQIAPADRAWANRVRGLTQIRTGDRRKVADALALIDANLKANPFSFEDQRARAVLLNLLPGKRDESIQALEALDKSGLLSSQDRYLLASLYLARGDWPACKQQMTRIAALPNPDPDHLATFINTLIGRGELEEAARRLADLKKNPRVPPQNVGMLALEASLLKAQKRDTDLLALLQNHAKNTPDNILAVAELLERNGFPAEAEAAFRAFVARDPKQPERQLNLIAFLTRQNRPADALALCAEAWKTCPAEPTSSASAAVLLLCKDHTPEQAKQVETWLENALKANPDSLVIKRNLASLRNLQNRADQTEAIYREILARNPEDLEALNNLAFLLAFREGKGAEALKLVDLALQIAGSEPSFLDTRGVIHLQSGQVERALEDLRAALALAPDVPVLHFHLALALQRAGQIEQARKALQQAESLGLKSESVDPLERALHAKLRKDLMP